MQIIRVHTFSSYEYMLLLFFQIEEIFTDLNHCRMPWMQESRSSDICQDKSKLINLAQIVKCAPHNIAAPHHSRCTNSTWENSLKSCSRLQPCKHRLKSPTFTTFINKIKVRIRKGFFVFSLFPPFFFKKKKKQKAINFRMEKKM